MVMSRLWCLVGRGTVRAELRRGRKVLWAAEADWSDHDSLVEAVAALAGQAELPVWRRTIRFQLATELVQRRTLSDLPPLGRAQIGVLVALNPHRYFRRAGRPLATAAAWLGPRGRRVAVGVATEVALLQALVRGSAEAGLSLDGIEVDEPVQGAPLSLLPPDERVRQEGVRVRWTRRLALAAAIAWLCFGGTVVFARVAERRRVSARLAEIREPVAAVLAAEARADSVERMVRRMADEGRSEGEVVATLLRVAIALPDSSFLTQLRVDGNGVGLVAGAAQRPTAVLAALEGKAGLTAPRFSGRTTRDLIGGRPVERFAIGFGERAGHP
jgi:hypothetical protein